MAQRSDADGVRSYAKAIPRSLRNEFLIVLIGSVGSKSISLRSVALPIPLIAPSQPAFFAFVRQTTERLANSSPQLILGEPRLSGSGPLALSPPVSYSILNSGRGAWQHIPQIEPDGALMRLFGCACLHVPRVTEEIRILCHPLQRAVPAIPPQRVRPARGNFLD